MDSQGNLKTSRVYALYTRSKWTKRTRPLWCLWVAATAVIPLAFFFSLIMSEIENQASEIGHHADGENDNDNDNRRASGAEIEALARAVLRRCLDLGSRDNMTIVLADLRPRKPQTSGIGVAVGAADRSYLPAAGVVPYSVPDPVAPDRGGNEHLGPARGEGNAGREDKSSVSDLGAKAAFDIPPTSSMQRGECSSELCGGTGPCEGAGGVACVRGLSLAPGIGQGSCGSTKEREIGVSAVVVGGVGESGASDSRRPTL